MIVSKKSNVRIFSSNIIFFFSPLEIIIQIAKLLFLFLYYSTYVRRIKDFIFLSVRLLDNLVNEYARREYSKIARAKRYV